MTAVKGAGEEINTRSEMENSQHSGVHLSPNHHVPSVAPAWSKYPHPPSPAETVTVNDVAEELAVIKSMLRIAASESDSL